MIIKGKAFWCKIVGDPVQAYDKDEKEWCIDVGQLDEATIEKLTKMGMRPSYIKDKGDERGKFLQLRRKALKTDGTPAQPIEIQDAHGEPWDGKTLIGNGSTINVAIGLNTVKWKGDQWLKPSLISVQVWDLVPYQPKGFPRKAAPDANPEGVPADKW